MIILSGDHIYKMNYGRMLKQHQDAAADVTVATLVTDPAESRHFGVVDIDRENRITGFLEKPKQTELRLLRLRLEPSLPLLVAVVWLVAYVIFLFFWLPSNTFYKLFCLPAIIVIVAHVLMGYQVSHQRPRRYRVALLVVTMALANLAFYIFPYSRPDYNQALRFAHRMGRAWSDRTVVYYSDFIVDDWFIRYFNPRTTWKQIDPVNGVANFVQDADRDLGAGHEVWVDGTTAVALAQSWPGVTAHFDAAQEDACLLYTSRCV